MKSFTAVVEKCPDTGLYIGYIPGFAGAHSQGATLDELKGNLEEVVGMVLPRHCGGIAGCRELK
jgi:predicted RNase H-like HicB family nuclease